MVVRAEALVVRHFVAVVDRLQRAQRSDLQRVKRAIYSEQSERSIVKRTKFKKNYGIFSDIYLCDIRK